MPEQIRRYIDIRINFFRSENSNKQKIIGCLPLSESTHSFYLVGRKVLTINYDLFFVQTYAAAVATDTAANATMPSEDEPVSAEAEASVTSTVVALSPQ